MGEAVARTRLAYPEYLVQEARSATKHEWLDGEVFAMSGGTPEHAALAAAVAGELRSALRDRPCRVFSSDLRIRVQATGLATYPDLSVVCGRLETHPEDADAVVNPALLVEVLSDSTEAYDRGEKFRQYRTIPALREVLFVSQHAPRFELYRRGDSGTWELHEAGAGESLALASVGCPLAVDDVYRNPLP